MENKYFELNKNLIEEYFIRYKNSKDSRFKNQLVDELFLLIKKDFINFFSASEFKNLIKDIKIVDYVKNQTTFVNEQKCDLNIQKCELLKNFWIKVKEDKGQK